MTIDPVRELSIRAIAHNLADKYPGEAQDPSHSALAYAHRLARLFVDADRADGLADAAVDLWREATATVGSPRDLSPLGLSPRPTEGSHHA